jgi:hypothetical protein
MKSIEGLKHNLHVMTFSPEDELQITEAAVSQIRLLNKSKLFNSWRYVVNSIFKPERLNNERAREFYFS